MESKKKALAEILEFAKKLKKDKAIRKLEKKPKIEVEVESESEEVPDTISSLLASLKD
jgi:hypothetical protein